MKKFFKEFKEFITRGNIMHLAVGVIIGAAFGKIVNSLVNDMIMPLIAVAIGGVSVKDLKWVLRPAEMVNGTEVAEAAVYYGNFLQSIIEFLIIALCIFLILKIMMGLQKKIDALNNEFKLFVPEEEKNKIKQLKAEGKTRKEIKAILEEEKKQKAEEEKRLAEANKPQTQEELLKEIRDLLKENNNKKKAGK